MLVNQRGIYNTRTCCGVIALNVETESGSELEVGATPCTCSAWELAGSYDYSWCCCDIGGGHTRGVFEGHGCSWGRRQPLIWSFIEEKRGGHSVLQQILKESDEHSRHLQRLESCSQHASPRSKADVKIPNSMTKPTSRESWESFNCGVEKAPLMRFLRAYFNRHLAKHVQSEPSQAA